MTVQPVVSSSSTTQPSSDEPALQARDSILAPTPPKMPLGSVSGLPDSTSPGESLLGSDSSDSQVRKKDVHSAEEKLNRTSKTQRMSNEVSNETKANIQLATVIGVTTLGAFLALFTGGLSLLPTVFVVLFGNASALATYGGSEFFIGTTDPNKEDKENKDKSEQPAAQPEPSPSPSSSYIPPSTAEGEPDNNDHSDPIRDRSVPGHPEPVCIFIDNSVVNIDNSTTINNNGFSSGASHATGEGGRISVHTQTSDELFPELNQVGVEVTTQTLTSEQLRELITPSTHNSEIVDRLLDNHAVNGGTVITAQVSDPTCGITYAVISVPNEYLPQSDPSAASQTLIPQAAQLDASGGWIRYENGWRERNETPRVFATQGTISARDAMWRRSSVEDSKSSTGASRLSPQNSVSAAGISKPVTSFTNSLLSNQSAQSQVAQPGASGGWIRDKNGWIERNETPRVFATQGSASARDAMWRNHSAPVAAGSQNTLPGSLLKSGVDTPIVTTQDATSSRNTSNTISRRSVNDSKLSTGASRLSPQNSVSAAGIPQPVTSLTNTPSSNNAQLEQSVEKHYEVHIPAPILTTEGTISGRSLNYSRGLFNNVKDIEEIRKQIRHQLYLEDYRTLAALTPIAGGGNRNNLVAAPVNKQNLVMESSV
ncbi:hypothetical protein [Vibrio aestuarianus]|uniref:Uncharacterized protein n=1 Tax=Vibrio aestuarianus TaxID=28171 RepID=A0A9X4F7L7_9VIBR|nr:hypothetical protein [Vibrio aestuarianus]MDE1236221.1 hypothetical protein [Vibrio aestuarianus]MDE1247105.1 hypothetical protein [Vibrio aestuarianus]MDE1346299.1 hypothetical protein [Vibrio aestuarianus]NGZ64181.1 hypothetical protein [Vibrio aestuarianus subsp. cardii]